MTIADTLRAGMVSFGMPVLDCVLDTPSVIGISLRLPNGRAWSLVTGTPGPTRPEIVAKVAEVQALYRAALAPWEASNRNGFDAASNPDEREISYSGGVK